MRRAEKEGDRSFRIQACSTCSVAGEPFGWPRIADSEKRAARSGSACDLPNRGSASSAFTVR